LDCDIAAFADTMSTSYGRPIELVLVDPDNQAQTELANTSATNLPARCRCPRQKRMA